MFVCICDLCGFIHKDKLAMEYFCIDPVIALSMTCSWCKSLWPAHGAKVCDNFDRQE